MAGFFDFLQNPGAGMTGLFGAGEDPNRALLGEDFSASSQRRAMLKKGMMSAGMSLLAQKPTQYKQGALTPFANALGEGIGGADQGKAGYLETAKAAHQKRLTDEFIATAPLELKALARAYPDQLAKAKLDNWEQTQKAFKPANQPAVIQSYEYAKGQGFKGTLQDWIAEGKGEGVVITNPDGTTTRIGGKADKQTEGDKRAAFLSKLATGSAPQALEFFDTLADPMNSLGKAAQNVGGDILMTPEGQIANAAIENIVAASIYALSGQAAPVQEVKIRTRMLMPTVLDKPATIAYKKQQLQIMIDALAERSGSPGVLPPSAAPDVNVPEQDGYTIEEVQ